MKVILRDYVKNLGYRDDIVEVKPGYANNYLLPQGLAIPGTPGNIKQINENQRQAAHRRAKQIEEANQKAQQIETLDLNIEALAGSSGKIYGSVTPLQIKKHLQEQGIDVDQRKINIPQDIKELGSYSATVVLDKEVSATLNFNVVEKADA
jgi:large subunit ribosomal protein L9